VGWNVVVGGAAVITAISTGSVSLIGFGINAVVDSSVSVVLVRRFGLEAAGRVQEAQRAEGLALRIARVAFVAVALYLSVQAVWSLAVGRHPETTWFGIAEAVASLLALPWLALSKYRLSRRLASAALRADSYLTWSGVALALLALVALVLVSALRWWWADSIGALGIAGLLIWQARRGMTAGEA